MQTLISAIGSFFADLIAELVENWRRDNALVDKGAASQAAKTNEAAVEAERRAASTLRRTEDQTIDTLRKGDF